MSTPNILFITDDQHRWDFYTNETVPSLQVPNLDRLRAQGTMLTNAYSNCPVCMPARMTWVHGVYPSQVADGLMQNWHAWPAHLPGMPRVLQQAGYHTTLVGKLHAQGRWHNDLTDAKFVNETKRRGFHDVFETAGKSFALRVDCNWTHHLRSLGLLGRYREDLLRRVEQLGGYESGEPTFLATEDTMDSFTGRHARAWLENYADTRPFFLHASFCGPHFPLDPPAEYHRRYRAEEMPVPVGVNDPARIAFWQRRTAAYCAMIEHVDHEVGLLLDLLDARGLAEHTLVIFGTDHGDMMGHHDQAHKGPFYDTSCRTPYIVRWPGRVPTGQTLDGPVESVDIPATIMDAAGLGSDPSALLNGSPGRSFLGYIMGETEAPRGWAYAESGPQSGGWRMCREKAWKYVFSPDGEYLFDMANDPWETRNLIDDPAQTTRISRMRVQLIASMQRSVTPSRWRMGEPTYTPDGRYNYALPEEATIAK